MTTNVDIMIEDESPTNSQTGTYVVFTHVYMCRQDRCGADTRVPTYSRNQINVPIP